MYFKLLKPPSTKTNHIHIYLKVTERIHWCTVHNLWWKNLNEEHSCLLNIRKLHSSKATKLSLKGGLKKEGSVRGRCNEVERCISLLVFIFGWRGGEWRYIFFVVHFLFFFCFVLLLCPLNLEGFFSLLLSSSFCVVPSFPLHPLTLPPPQKTLYQTQICFLFLPISYLPSDQTKSYMGIQ